MNTHCYDNVSVGAMRCRDHVYSPNVMAMLTVVGLSYGRVPVEDVTSGKAKPIEATLSMDGRAWVAAWHQKPNGVADDDSVYVERHTTNGCVFHGFVDKRSRRIVQAG